MSTPSKTLFFAGLMLACMSSRGVASLDELVKDSPFLPKPTGAEAMLVPTENEAVEFRGIIITEDGVIFGLYDRSRQTGAWVGKEQAGADFVVHSYDPANDMVSVEYQGRKFNLTLFSSKVSTSAPSAPMSVPVAGRAGTTLASVRVEDRRRLELIAEEVQKRRAARQAAASGTAPQR